MIKFWVTLVVLCCAFTGVLLSDPAPSCVIELECTECIPENMPLVTSHRAVNGSVTAYEREEVAFSCASGKFLAYPLLSAIVAVCDAGRFRVRHDQALKHLLELGCQENVFEDVLHEVEGCGSPLQGRAYQNAGSAGAARHLASLCYDEDAAEAAWIRTNSQRDPLDNHPHREARGPLSILGNFNHMFDAKTRHDAERLFGDDHATNLRLHQMFKHEKHTFAGQTLTAGKLLSRRYFDDQDMRVTDFPSNKVSIWMSIADGNWDKLHQDVGEVMRRARFAHDNLELYSGTHGVSSLRTSQGRTQLYLKPGGRFPVPKYLWTVLLDKQRRKGIAIVTLNDPFVAVSEIRDAVFCESMCTKVPWLQELRRNRHYETPLLGLVFCCNVHDFSRVVNELPKHVIQNIPRANEGLLIDV